MPSKDRTNSPAECSADAQQQRLQLVAGIGEEAARGCGQATMWRIGNA
jgi:hypothetical protein